MRVPEENKDVTYFFHLAPIHLVHVVFVQKKILIQEENQITTSPHQYYTAQLGKLTFRFWEWKCYLSITLHTERDKAILDEPIKLKMQSNFLCQGMYLFFFFTIGKKVLVLGERKMFHSLPHPLLKFFKMRVFLNPCIILESTYLTRCFLNSSLFLCHRFTIITIITITFCWLFLMFPLP